MVNLDFSKNIEWFPINNEDLFFEPKVENVLLKGKATKWKILYREKTDGDASPISVRTNLYPIIKNLDLKNAIETFNNPKPIFIPELSSQKKNAMFQMVFGFPDIKVDDMGVTLVVTNSYDGLTRLKFRLGLFRYICSNMIVVPSENVAEIQIKHYKGNFQKELNEIVDIMIKSMLENDRLTKISDRIKDMSTEGIDSKISAGFWSLLTRQEFTIALCLIQKYSKIPCLTCLPGSSDASYDISVKGFDFYTNYFSGKDKNLKNKKKLKETWDEYYENILYNENVDTCWAIYNMLLKAFQVISNGNERVQKSLMLSNEFMF